MLDMIWNVTILGLLGWGAFALVRGAVRKVRR